jgi:hypothetical protein
MATNLPARYERRLGQALDRVELDATVELARVRAAEAIACAKVDAIGTVTHRAYVETTRLAIEEALASSQVPGLERKFNYLGTKAVVAMGERIDLLNRRLG